MRTLLSYWHLDGSMALFLILLCLGYFYFTGFKIVKESVCFLAGFLLIIISVASPLYFLGQNYLMSAHMLSHVILLLIAAPFIVLGIPEARNNKLLFKFSENLLKFPWLTWMAGVCIMWFWHIPIVFNRLFEGNYSEVLQNIHLISLLLAGILFSWPVIGPVKSSRMAPLNAVLYLSAACIFCSILGLLITFSPAGIYTRYIHTADHFGFLNMIRNQRGISAVVDRQIAGLIMWVPGCLIYLSVSMYLLMNYFKTKNEHSVLVNHNTDDGKSI